MNVLSVLYVLYAQDALRCIRFYRDAFGAEVLTSTPHWSELQIGNAVLGIHAGGTGHEPPSAVNIRVDDIAAACRAVKEAGGSIATPPERRAGEPIILAAFRDTEGNTIALTETVEPAPPSS